MLLGRLVPQKVEKKMQGMKKTGILQMRLTNFRSYERLNLSLDADLLPVVLTGHNGAGKTNILEAISFLSPGRGLRSARLSDVARREDADLRAMAVDGENEDGFDDDCAFENAQGASGGTLAPQTDACAPSVARLPVRWSVSAQVVTPGGVVPVGTGTVDGTQRRQVRIDGKTVTKQAALGDVFRCLWLTPAQDRLFCGDPVSRRRFLDRLVQAFDPAHALRTSEYNTAFKGWSRLLREGRYDNAWLTGLERQMVLNGVAIAASRLDIVERISKHLSENDLGRFPAPDIELTGLVEQALLKKSAVLVEEEFAALLKNGRKIYADGGSVAGPHTADFKVIHRQKNMDAGLCSTGEQKALLVSIILAEMKAQMKEQGHCPLLLLDEVAAHLDMRRRGELFDILSALPTQVWMTGTDPAPFDVLKNRACFYDVEESVLCKLSAA